MTGPAAVRPFLQVLARHPIVPPALAIPPSGEVLHTLLADLARGSESAHATTLAEVALGHGLEPEELRRRAGFLLDCLVLPPTGTHYEVLGVARDAAPEEIQRQWRERIRRWHPDALGGIDRRLADRARRVIAAYQTLKDPERRRQYDAELSATDPLRIMEEARLLHARTPGPGRLRTAGWATLAVLVGLVTAALLHARLPGVLP